MDGYNLKVPNVLFTKQEFDEILIGGREHCKSAFKKELPEMVDSLLSKVLVAFSFYAEKVLQDIPEDNYESVMKDIHHDLISVLSCVMDSSMGSGAIKVTMKVVDKSAEEKSAAK